MIYLTKLFLLSLFLLPATAANAASIDSTSNRTPEDDYEANLIRIINNSYSQSEPLSKAIYKSKLFKEAYKSRIEAPIINFNQILDTLSISDLRAKLFEPYAKKGYYFSSSEILDYYKNFNWYQPIFWDNNFNIKLNNNEEQFYQRVKSELNKKRKSSFLEIDKSYNSFFENIVNQQLFSVSKYIDTKCILDSATAAIIRNNGFCLKEALNQNSNFQKPIKQVNKFISTDFGIQLLHSYFSNCYNYIENDLLYPKLKLLLKNLFDEANKFSLSHDKFVFQDAIEFNRSYFSFSYYLLTGEKLSEPDKYINDFNKTPDINIYKSKNERLHRAMEWLQSYSFNVYDTNSVKRASFMAYLLNISKLKDLYDSLFNINEFMYGDGTELSLHNLSRIFWNLQIESNLAEIMNNANYEKIFISLFKLDPRNDNKINAVDSSLSVYFFPRRANPDKYILYQLVHPGNSENPDFRQSPRALDILAVFGNRYADSILINYHKVNMNWSGYQKKLNILKKKFSQYDVNKTFYTRWLDLFNILMAQERFYPNFMKHAGWIKKNLNTALAGLTYIYDFENSKILNYEMESVNKMSDPQPRIVGYIEPNIKFWNNMVHFIDLFKSTFKNNGISNISIDSSDVWIRDLLKFFIAVSKKELDHQLLNDDEFKRIANIAVEADSLGKTFNHLIPNVTEKPLLSTKSSDLFHYINKLSGRAECVKNVISGTNELLAVVEIGGYFYLTRGMAFSYQEFNVPLEIDWQPVLNNNIRSSNYIWMKDIMSTSNFSK
ncbi:MAG: DUF3160 domain-containing protein [Candidatus Kapabacteria bacterium]|nr:DUF3160 domain-containing protein [Candidatus Kapabacteria bacterium]